MKVKFTEHKLAMLTLPPGKRQVWVWDTEPKHSGLGLMLGRKTATYIAKIKRPDGTYRQEILGARGELSLVDATKKLIALTAVVNDGKTTPADNLRLSTTGPTVREAIESRVTTMKVEHCRPTAIASVHDELLKGRHLADWLDRPLRSITPWEVRERSLKIAEVSKHAANRIMTNFGAVWNQVEEECVLLKLEWPANPTRFAVRYSKDQPGFRKRHKESILWSELPAWRVRVEALPSALHRLFYYLVLFTGLRKSDAFTVRVEHMNLTDTPITIDVWGPNGVWQRELAPFSIFRPCPKGGHSKAFAIPLPQLLVDMLIKHLATRDLQKDNGWLFPGKSYRGAPCWRCADLGRPPHAKNGVAHMFDADRDSGIPSPHNYRRVYLNATEEVGMPEGVSKRLVNHADKTVTEGYRNQSEHLLSHWQEKVSAFLLTMLRGERHLRSVA